MVSDMYLIFSLLLYSTKCMHIFIKEKMEWMEQIDLFLAKNDIQFVCFNAV